MPMHIHLVYAWAPRQVLDGALDLAEGSTVAQALAASGWAGQHPELPHLQASVWGRRVNPSHVLRTGDRLEWTRALKVDPKVARRQRFQRQGARQAGLFAQRRAGAKPGY